MLAAAIHIGELDGIIAGEAGDYPIELTDVDGGRRSAQLSLLAEVA